MKLATIGEILVEFVSHERNCALEKITEYSGPYPSGAPAIFLDQAARMGAVTEMIGGVGSDAFGRSVLSRLRQDGVGVDGVKISEGFTTGTAFVTYFDNGTRDFIFHLDGTAVDQFTVPASLFEPADTLLHVSASSLSVAPIRKIILEQVKSVSEAGGSVSFDPNARPELLADPATSDAIYAVMAQSTYIFPSTSDLAFLYPKLSEDQALEKLEIGINAQIQAIAISRGLAANAQALNELVNAKNNILAMQKPKPKTKAKSKSSKEETLTCEHCGTTGLTKLTYSRWHGDKCKEKK